MRILLLAAGSISACTLASQPEQQAVLIAPTAAARAELHDIVSAALGNPALTLADNALIQESVLIVERVPRTDSSGVLLDGRERGRPERFVLVTQGSRCLLVHERTGQRRQLQHAQCRPVASTAP